MGRVATAIVIAATAALTMPALATAPPTTTPPDEAPVDGGAAAELAPVTTESLPTAGNPPVEVVDQSGNVVATITVTDVEPAWTGFDEDDAPDSGYEYLRVTVVVESRSPRGLFAVDPDDDFILQDVDGFVINADVVAIAEQAAREHEPVAEVELAEGETIEVPLTFEVVSGVAPQALYYAPGPDRLITVHAFQG